ncbi:MAG: DUF6125 family protein [Promethearchaeota archaeon]
MNVDKDRLIKEYGLLGQILDGLWFITLEKKFGFENAYKIDEEVWEIYSAKEAKRLKRLLGFEQPTIEDIKNILKLSLFNQSLEFQIKVLQQDPTILRFIVTNCKTLKGMHKVGRSKDQIEKICEGIGIAFFSSMLNAIVPNTKVKCVSCPYHPENDSMKDESQVCSWDFIFPHKLD